MVNIGKAIKSAAEDLDSVSSWVAQEHEIHFSRYFDDLHHLSHRMDSKEMTITDKELESILIDLPLQLFSAAEEINQLKLNLEVIKLRNKKTLTEKIKNSKESTATMRKDVAEAEMFEDKVLELAFSCLLDRVDREISYSKELIMGAKKVWDSRRKTESVNPTSEVSTEKTPIYT